MLGTVKKKIFSFPIYKKIYIENINKNIFVLILNFNKLNNIYLR